MARLKNVCFSVFKTMTDMNYFSNQDDKKTQSLDVHKN